MYPRYLQDKIDYIEKESEHHGGKKLFVIWEIERAQNDLVNIMHQKFFTQDDTSTKNPIEIVKSFFHKLQRELRYLSDKNDIEYAISYLKRMYGITDEQIDAIQKSYREVGMRN